MADTMRLCWWPFFPQNNKRMRVWSSLKSIFRSVAKIWQSGMCNSVMHM